MANIKKLPLFVRCVIQNFPFIEEDFDALTNYELICKVVEYLNKVIASQNEVIGVANNLQDAFQQLHDYVENYFDNLDVQDEINNKLDAMAESGELTEIIGAYLQSTALWCFDTVADMKLSENLIAGSYARTLGFHTINDGGAGIYKITDTGTANEKDVIAVGSLYANLIYGSQINVKQLGAYGDDEHDDAAVINYAMTLSNDVYLPQGTYLANSTIAISGSAKKFICDGKIDSSANNAVTITARTSTITVQSITGINTNNAVYMTNDGNNVSHNKIEIGTVGSVLNGIVMSANNGRGIMYNNVEFRYISATGSCILLETGDVSNAYVSENNFTGGRCTDGGAQSGTGVTILRSTGQVSSYHAYNKFIHIGFETIHCDANLQRARRTLFLNCRTAEGVSGDYAFILAEDCWDNYFDCSSIEVQKINDNVNQDRGYNTYKAQMLTINGTPYAGEMRVFHGKKLFENKWEYNQYAQIVDLYDQLDGQVSSTYYYNGMTIQAGGDEAGNYVVTLDNAFNDFGITDFFIFVKKKVEGSTLKINLASGSTIIKSAAFAGAMDKKLFHVMKVDRISTTNGTAWTMVECNT